MPYTAACGTVFNFELDGIPYDYAPQGFRKGIAREVGPWINCELDVPWEYSDDLANKLMGIGRVIGVPGAGTVIWPIPATYPDNPTLFCESCECVETIGPPRASVAGGFAADICRYAVAFRRPRFDISGGEFAQWIDPTQANQPYLSVRKRVGTQQIPIPESSLQMADQETDGPVTQRYHLEEGVIEYAITRYWLPYLPGADLDALVNKVNDADFLNWPRGHVKFASYETQREIDAGGGTMQQVDYSIQILTQRPWNSMWSAVPGRGFQPLDDATAPNEYADLSPILEY